MDRTTGMGEFHHAIGEQARLQAESIRVRKEWIEARRRDLWERMDRLKADLGMGDVPAAEFRDHLAASGLVFPPAPAGPAYFAARGEQVQPGGEASGCETQREPDRPQVEDEAERQWLRSEVLRMRGDGWSWEELADIGFGRDLLAHLGLAPAAEPRAVDLTDVQLDGLRQDSPAGEERPSEG